MYVLPDEGEGVGMKAGDLRHRVTIQYQKPPEQQNSFGEVANAWQTLATVWAQVDVVAGNEQVQNERWLATATHNVQIRRRTDVLPKMQVVYGSRTLDILSILEPNKPGDPMTLVCVEVI